MRKLLLLISLALFAIGAAFAQKDDALKREKMFREVQEFKMKYLAQEMDLSESQKAKFYELYEEMSQSKRECYKEYWVLNRRVKHEKNATEADYQNVTQAFDKANAEWALTGKQYNEKFAEFLTPKQIYKMKEAENDFRSKFEEMKQNRKKEHRKRPDIQKSTGE